jgi:3-deoxy-D-manno-octulosonic-acid transferase
MFLEKEAAVQARDEEELFAKMFALLQDQAQAAALGKRAYLLVQENQGASQRTAELIKRIVAK